jgi:hypothetical protein
MVRSNDYDADDRTRQSFTPTRYPGSLMNRAARAGKTVKAYAEANIHTDGPVGKMARMYYLKAGSHGAGKSNMSGAGDTRPAGASLYQMG